jgi:protein-S-isoprenylcysteine O-methyltransferase Ste14
MMRFLLEWHIHRSGFDEVGHDLTIYMVFPEEGRRVSSEVYSYIRHPMYAGDLCMASGFTVLRNNPLAVLTALISFIPFLFEVRLEDEELIQRFGEEHRRYIEEVPAIFPHFRDL